MQSLFFGSLFYFVSFLPFSGQNTVFFLIHCLCTSLFPVSVELSITYHKKFRKHWTSTIHLAALVSVYLWQGDSGILWSEILFPSPWVAWHPNPTFSACPVIGGWNMKHPKHQCWHRDSGRNPAEDYPNTGRGEDLLNLFSTWTSCLFENENNGEC